MSDAQPWTSDTSWGKLLLGSYRLVHLFRVRWETANRNEHPPAVDRRATSARIFLHRLLQSQTKAQGVSTARLLKALGAALVLAVIAGTLCWLSLRTFASWISPPVVTQFVAAMVYIALAGTVAFSLFPTTRAPIEFRFTSFSDIGLSVFAWLITVCVGLLFYVLFSAFSGGLLTRVRDLLSVVTDVKRLRNQSELVWFIAIVRGCFLAPLFEEFFFRGLLVRWLEGRFRWPSAIVVSAALFSLMHVYPIALAYTFLFGLSTAYMRLRTASTFNSYVMHVFNNVMFTVSGLYFLRNMQ